MIKHILETYVPAGEVRQGAIANLTALAKQEEALIVEYQEWPKDINGHDILHWSYIGCLYYTFTIVTTIGYGSAYPTCALAELLIFLEHYVSVIVQGAFIAIFLSRLMWG